MSCPMGAPRQVAYEHSQSDLETDQDPKLHTGRKAKTRREVAKETSHLRYNCFHHNASNKSRTVTAERGRSDENENGTERKSPALEALPQRTDCKRVVHRGSGPGHVDGYAGLVSSVSSLRPGQTFFCVIILFCIVL